MIERAIFNHYRTIRTALQRVSPCWRACAQCVRSSQQPSVRVKKNDNQCSE